MKEAIKLFNELKNSTKLAYGQEYFECLARLVQRVTNADYTFVIKVDPNDQIAKPIVSLYHENIIENVNYNVEGTPCLDVIDNCIGYFPSSVQDLYPKDEYLSHLKIEGYLGVVITSEQSNLPYAIINCLYEHQPKNPKEHFAILEFIAGLIKIRAEREFLIMNNEELKQKKEFQENRAERSELLLKEIHHRIKNNLQIVASLLNLQSEKTKNKDLQHIVLESKNRIQSIALMHELLYQSKDFIHIQVESYLESIVKNAIHSLDCPEIEIDLKVKDEHMKIDQLISLGLILNEALTNFLKYSYPIDHRISIEYSASGTSRSLEIKDKGHGFPPKILEGNYNETLGIDLIFTLTEQISGHAKLYNDNGAVINITFEYTS